jgi:hypothetical protein
MWCTVATDWLLFERQMHQVHLGLPYTNVMLYTPTKLCCFGTLPKLMASPTSWHTCSNRLLSTYGEPCGAAYTMHRNKGLWKALSKRSKILVPSLAVFQTVVLLAHLSLTSTAMPPMCFRTTPCVTIGLATSKQQNPGKTGNVLPGKWCVSVKAATSTCWNRSSRCSCVSSFVIVAPWIFHRHTCKSL